LAKFVFSLETLLQHRERLEQRERDELFRLDYKYQVEVRFRQSLSERFNETMVELSRKHAEQPANEELSLFLLYINRLKQEINESEKRLSQLNLEVQKQKEIVVEATKKKKALASLKAKREREFAFAQEKQEQKEIDEIVVTRYTKNESDRPTQAAIKKERPKPHESRDLG
jgi:flagellar protein FliJ